MAKHPAVGEMAPDFELEGTHGTFRLSEHRGEKVLLLFYPGDETTVCTRQFCSYRDDSEAFGALGVTAVGISGKDVASKESFADNHDLNVPLLADPDLSVAAALRRAPSCAKMVKRAVIMVDEDGRVAHRHDHALGLDFQTVADLKKTLDELPSSTSSAGRADSPLCRHA